MQYISLHIIYLTEKHTEYVEPGKTQIHIERIRDKSLNRLDLESIKLGKCHFLDYLILRSSRNLQFLRQILRSHFYKRVFAEKFSG